MSSIPEFSIGGFSCSPPVLLAPMCGFYDLPARLSLSGICRPGLMFTEMLNPGTLLMKKQPRKTRDLIRTDSEDRPLAYQLYGSDPGLIAEAAVYAEDLGAELIDINMGCTTMKITRQGFGASLLKKPVLAGEIIKATVRRVSIPVTAKLRLGWSSCPEAYLEAGRRIEDAGASAITLHARFAEQKFSGRADRDAIARLVELTDIPVIGNGDIDSPESALRMIRETGCRGVMIGRYLRKNPWLIRDTVSVFEGHTPPSPPAREDVFELGKEHFRKSLALFGPRYGEIRFRKWKGQYARYLPEELLQDVLSEFPEEI